MFKRRTLFVLGAGASQEFGLPVGTELAKTIANKTAVRFEHGRFADGGDSELTSQLFRKEPNNVGQHLKACQLVQHGVQLASSIDDFLDVHAKDPHAQRVGKMAIVRSILEAERHSKLYFDRSNMYHRMSVSSFENTWVVKLIRVLCRGVGIESRNKLFDNIAFIVFNYDRCLEHFLLHAIRQLYFVNEPDALEILSSLTIVHPYGVAAPFPAATASGVPLGGDYDGLRADYWSLSEGIRTYSEQITDEHELARIHDEVNRAERIVFLGFAFHEQNMSLLKPKDGIGRRVEMFATALGMSDSDVDVVKSQLLSLNSDKVRNVVSVTMSSIQVRSDLTCAGFFDSYSKSLPA